MHHLLVSCSCRGGYPSTRSVKLRVASSEVKSDLTKSRWRQAQDNPEHGRGVTNRPSQQGRILSAPTFYKPRRPPSGNKISPPWQNAKAGEALRAVEDVDDWSHIFIPPFQRAKHLIGPPLSLWGEGTRGEGAVSGISPHSPHQLILLSASSNQPSHTQSVILPGLR